MKNESMTVIAVCPLCGKAYSGHPAISRADHETAICQDCGIRQALDSIGVDREEQEKILDVIHKAERRTGGAHCGG